MEEFILNEILEELKKISAKLDRLAVRCTMSLKHIAICFNDIRSPIIGCG